MKLCLLPWMHIEADAMGNAKPCCLYEDAVGDFKTDSLKDIWNGEKLVNLRNDFLVGNKPNGCNKCWHAEDAGIKSKRMTDNQKLDSYNFRTLYQSNDIPYPVYYDLKLGTVCNLKCRTCSTASSFKWEEDEIALHGHSLNPNVKSYWISDEAPIWTEIEKHLAQVAYFDFTGGEPFLIKKHVEILQKCVDKGFANNISIHYNTNGTIHPTKNLLNIWKRFKHVHVMVSLDGIGEQFEYMRHPAVWKEVEATFKFLRQQDYLHTTICYTVSALNLYYIPEFLEWCDTQNLEWHETYLNTLYYPTYLSVQALPPRVYIAIEEKLTDDRCMPFLNMMKSHYNNGFDKFLDTTLRLDKIRNESFSNTFSELYEIIK